MVDLFKDCKRIDCCVEDISSAAEGDVADAERGGIVVCACIAVFAHPHEKIESNPDDVYNVLRLCVASDVVLEDVVEDGNGEQFDAVWWRVLLCVAA